MSINVKFLNQQEYMVSKNCQQKKLSNKNIPINKVSKSLRGKVEKGKKNKQEPLGIINENDVNIGKCSCDYNG